MKIKFLDYDELNKAKHLLVYANQNTKPIKIDGYTIETDESVLGILDNSKIKYERLD